MYIYVYICAHVCNPANKLKQYVFKTCVCGFRAFVLGTGPRDHHKRNRLEKCCPKMVSKVKSELWEPKL